MRYIYILVFSCLSQILLAQTNDCKVSFTQAQTDWLKEFQTQMYNGKLVLNKKQTVYVPLKLHLVGTNAGLGYFSIDNLLKSVCELNTRFEPTGFHFYLYDTINYINNDDLYAGNAGAIWSNASNHKDYAAVNVFFHGLNTEGWCGVYFGGVDVVFILNRCQLPGSTTLAHEIGHFFSLPHTFSGWENGNIPSDIEKLDGTNCSFAGDGFCDTKPDYVGQRWSCPLGWQLTDPNNIKFKPDSSLYMNYALDQCHSRFSAQQMLAMRGNLQSRNITASVQPNLTALSAPELITPINNDSNQHAKSVTLTWQKVEGAYAYHVQVARYAAWDYLNFERLIYSDTSVTVSLFGNWPFSWRVKAITKGNVCTNFSETRSFYAKETPVGFAELNLDNDFEIYPNPLKVNDALIITTKHKTEIIITNTIGQTMQTLMVEPNKTSSIKFSQTGIYFLTILDKQGKIRVNKLVVN